ncbi:MAG: hypothetical protein AB7K24_28820 [Gemmataceae bacterium]
MSTWSRSLVDANVRRAEWTKSAPADEAKCLRVERVSPHGPAGQHDVLAGDLLVSVDGFPGFECGLHMQAGPKAPTRYEFWSQTRRELLQLEVTGVDIGVTLKPTLVSIVGRYQPHDGDPEDLLELWQAGEWQPLRELCRRTLGTERIGGFLGLFGGEERPRRDVNHPALLFLGAAEWELGNPGLGFELVMHFQEHFARFWTMNYHAVTAYYLGQALMTKDPNRGLAMMLEGFHMDASLTRIADHIETLGMPRPVTSTPWQGKSFPLRYDLPALDEAGNPTHALDAALAALDDKQLLIVCLLATYRGNGPYDDFQNRYKHLSKHLGTALPMLHVITATNQRRADRPHWYQAEDRNRKEGVPFHVLLEKNEAITRAIEPHGAPWILLLDARGTIRYEGLLDSVDLWDVLALRG